MVLRLRVEVKGHELQLRITVPMPESVMLALARHLELHPAQVTPFGTLLFTTDTGHAIWRHNFRSGVWRPSITKPGLSGVKIRHLRHTGASMVLAAGGSVKDVSERLGDTSTRMADELYTELYESRGHEIAKRLDDLLCPKTSQQQSQKVGHRTDECSGLG
jgi:integrase